MQSGTASYRNLWPASGRIPFPTYTERLHKIRDKEGRIVPLSLNQHQRKIRQAKREALEKGKLARFLLTKFRQFGGTTLEVAQSDYLTGTYPGQYAITIAHDLESTIKIFGIANRLYENLSSPNLCCPPAKKKPLFHWERAQQNRRELRYPEADSQFFIGTAGNVNFGHGLTINKAHLSEAARFSDLMGTLAALEGVPQSGEIMQESTPNGAQGPYYELNQEAHNDPTFEWTLIFFTWFEFGEYAVPCLNEDERQTIIAEVATGTHPRYGAEEQALALKLLEEGKPALTPEQWKWRRWKRNTLKARFFEQYPEDFVSCWLASGRPFFDLFDVMGGADGTVIRKEEGDALWIYEDPVAGREYVLWADPAEGIERGTGDDSSLDPVRAANSGLTDFSVWGVIDRETREDVAVFCGRIGVSELARMIDVWGRHYNDALAAVERNNHGHAVLLKLEEICAYPNVYRHMDRIQDDGGEETRPGFPTDKSTRSTALDDLDMEMREGLYRPIDPRMKEQMKTFVVNAKGKAEAGDGYHDDLVLGRAIGGYVCRLPANVTLSMVA